MTKYGALIFLCLAWFLDILAALRTKPERGQVSQEFKLSAIVILLWCILEALQ